MNGAIMQSAKEKIIKILEQQPEDSTFDELIREMKFAQMVERGLEDVKHNRVISNEEMKRRIALWQK
jgi:predicted Zn-ribbon and HTH transcriptional regulator